MKIPYTLEELLQQFILGALSAATVTGAWWLVTGGELPSRVTVWAASLSLMYLASLALSLRKAREIEALKRMYDGSPDEG